MKLSNPAPGRPITSPYGPRRHPITGELGRKHRGIDYGGRFNVLAAGPGVVWKISYNGNKRTGGGHVVIIDHGEIHTVYYHGAHRTPLRVGDRVNTGDFLYLSGSTGASTGDHLHFEVRRGPRGAWGTDVDPTPYLNGNAAVAKLPVTGRPDRASWRAWQTDLQAKKLYLGRIDGIPGPITHRAIQGWAGVRQDGVLGPITRRAVQQKLGVKVDGVWGRETWSTIQRKLNEGSM